MKLLNSYKNRKIAEKDASKLMTHGIPSIISGHEKMHYIFADIDEKENKKLVDIFVEEKAFPIATLIINDNTPLWQKLLRIVFKRKRKNINSQEIAKEVIKS